MKNIVSVLFTLILCVFSNFSYSQSEYVEILCTNEDFKQSEFYKVKPFNGKQHTYNSFLGELFIQFDEDQIVMTDKDTGQILEFDLEEKKSLYVNGKKRPNVICEYKNLELINKVILKDKFKPSFANQSNEENKKLKIDIEKKTQLVENLENKLKKLYKNFSDQKNNKVCPKSKNSNWDNCFGIDVSSKGKYEGFFKNGKKDGLGTFKFTKGHKYIGEWRKGKIDGLGTYDYENGFKYVGEFKNNVIDGLGTKYYPDGRIKKGEYKNYNLNGYGITYNANGTIDKFGLWKDDEFQYAENSKMDGNQNVTVNSKTSNNSILIELIRKVDRKDFLTEKDLCDLEYKISNNSKGTLYKISIGVDGWDDRNTKFEELLSFRINNTDGGFKYTKIPKGESGIFIGGSFKGNCRYLDRLKIDKIDPDDCNVRMLSEEDDCNKIVKIIPGQTMLKIN